MHTTRHGMTPTNRSANLGGNKTGINTTPPPILVLIPTNLHTANFLPLPSPLSLPLQLSLPLLAIYSMQTSTRSLSGYPKPLKPKPDQSKAKQSKASEAKRGKASKAIYAPKEKRLVCKYTRSKTPSKYANTHTLTRYTREHKYI
jgi:hypothetical protein